MENFNEVTMIELQMQRNEIMAKFKKKIFLEVILDVLNNIDGMLKTDLKINENNKLLIEQVKNKINNF